MFMEIELNKALGLQHYSWLALLVSDKCHQAEDAKSEFIFSLCKVQ